MRPHGPAGRLFLIAMAGSVAFHASCRGETMDDEAVRADLARLENTAVFFGHQSVGANIIRGMEEISARLDMSGPSIRGAEIGTNGDPEGKIRDFERIIRAGGAAGAGIAFMKLCYADFGETTDTAALFSLYRETMARLSRDFPAVTFVHFTAPLRAAGLKDRVKNLIGRPSDSREGNIKREEYNALVRAEFGGRGRLFDLALLEAQDGRGKAGAQKFRNRTYYRLRAEYTDDNGHLNALGRSRIAGRLAAFLAALTGR